MTDVARTSFSSLSGAVLAKPDAYARARYQAANDRYAHYDRDPDLRSRSRAPVLEAWSDGEGFAVEEHRPRAAFAAQLFAQENPGTRAHVEDYAGVSASYARAEQRPSQPRTGAAVTIEL
ncbi:MAG: hypothetical protein JNL66_02680 [Alphaproteobacteria bacterium]|nr:hypothetical protein [Alphaproteobacteria bacterium]